ncbi:MAG: peptide chain release factor N(5)-glutamine methyltransferase [Sphingomonadaceae bacterium]
MIIAQALRDATARLSATSDTARLDAEVLMAFCMGVSRSELLLRHLDQPSPAGFEDKLVRRLRHEPVAYITGEQEFYGRRFQTSPDVLIPRADSETVVQTALDHTGKTGRVLDCGTGSGALLISFLAERPFWTGVGVDASAKALAIAEANAGHLLPGGERALMLQRDWTCQGWTQDLGQFDLILANPPYVESAARLPVSVHKYEPAQALFAGELGMDDYQVLIPQIPLLLSPQGVAVVEIGALQADAVMEITRKAGMTGAIHHDLAGRNRAIRMTQSP